MRVIAIAAGVLLVLLSYRPLLSKRRRRVVSQAVGMVLASSLLACLAYLVFAIVVGIRSGFLIGFVKSYWLAIAVVAGVFVSARFVLLLRADLKVQHRFSQMAEGAACESCGEHGLVFRTFNGGLKAPSRREQDHPLAKCNKCGHEQEINAI